MLSRRLRHERLVAIEKAHRDGHSSVDVQFKYPSGPFWPNTPAPDFEMKRVYEVQRGVEGLQKEFGWDNVVQDWQTGEILVREEGGPWVPIGYFW